MERLTIWADMGLDDWEQTCYRVPSDPEGAYNILDLAFYYGRSNDEECANILQDISIKLKAYEDIGPTPEQLLEIDKMYAEKCREVAELKRQNEEAIAKMKSELERYYYLWHDSNEDSLYNEGRADAMQGAIYIMKGEWNG